MSNENQKKTTDAYREGYSSIRWGKRVMYTGEELVKEYPTIEDKKKPPSIKKGAKVS